MTTNIRDKLRPESIPDKYIGSDDNCIMLAPVGHGNHLWDLHSERIALQRTKPNSKSIYCPANDGMRFLLEPKQSLVKKIQSFITERFGEQAYNQLEELNSRSRKIFIEVWDKLEAQSKYSKLDSLKIKNIIEQVEEQPYSEYAENDYIGGGDIVALTNGNYEELSPYWYDRDGGLSGSTDDSPRSDIDY